MRCTAAATGFQTISRLLACSPAQVLLSHAHDLDIDEPDGDGDTVLHFLVKTAELECIQVRRQLGLHACSLRSPFDLWTFDFGLQVLLDAKVDVNAKGERGDTPLHMAVSYEDLDVVELLLNK